MADKAIHTAIMKNDIQQLQNLIQNEDYVNIQGYRGNEPLHVAIRYYSNTEIIHFLLDQGADLNLKKDNLNTPL